jgi:hypothetical protein
VLDHEKPHEKACGRHREQQAEPVAQIKGCPHQKPEQNQRPGRDDELDYAAQTARSAIAGQDLCQVARTKRDRGKKGTFALLQGKLYVGMAHRQRHKRSLGVIDEQRSCVLRLYRSLLQSGE